MLIIFGFFAVPIALIASAVATIVFRGVGWRIAAVVPILAVAAYFVIVLIPDWAVDPTSHNLFPFELGMHFWPIFPYMVVLLFLYTRATRPEPSRVRGRTARR